MSVCQQCGWPTEEGTQLCGRTMCILTRRASRADGPLQMGITQNDRLVWITFSQSVSLIGLPPLEALRIAGALIDNARDVLGELESVDADELGEDNDAA